RGARHERRGGARPAGRARRPGDRQHPRARPHDRRVAGTGGGAGRRLGARGGRGPGRDRRAAGARGRGSRDRRRSRPARRGAPARRRDAGGARAPRPPRQQCRHESSRPLLGGRRRRLGLSAQRQPARALHPGAARGSANDRARRGGADRQCQLGAGPRAAARLRPLQRRQGRDRVADTQPGLRTGAARHHGELCRAGCDRRTTRRHIRSGRRTRDRRYPGRPRRPGGGHRRRRPLLLPAGVGLHDRPDAAGRWRPPWLPAGRASPRVGGPASGGRRAGI
ncbi:MAG: 3-oxoacyl-[acyl-carrier protein] reductase, partial [uncultured Thermomicrobiales bacterium]